MLGNWDVPSARCSLPVAVFGAVLSVAVVCGRRRPPRLSTAARPSGSLRTGRPPEHRCRRRSHSASSLPRRHLISNRRRQSVRESAMSMANNELLTYWHRSDVS